MTINKTKSTVPFSKCIWLNTADWRITIKPRIGIARKIAILHHQEFIKVCIHRILIIPDPIILRCARRGDERGDIYWCEVDDHQHDLELGEIYNRFYSRGLKEFDWSLAHTANLADQHIWGKIAT